MDFSKRKSTNQKKERKMQRKIVENKKVRVSGPGLNIPHIKNDAPLNKSQVVVACHVTGIQSGGKDSGRTPAGPENNSSALACRNVWLALVTLWPAGKTLSRTPACHSFLPLLQLSPLLRCPQLTTCRA